MITQANESLVCKHSDSQTELKIFISVVHTLVKFDRPSLKRNQTKPKRRVSATLFNHQDHKSQVHAHAYGCHLLQLVCKAQHMDTQTQSAEITSSNAAPQDTRRQVRTCANVAGCTCVRLSVVNPYSRMHGTRSQRRGEIVKNLLTTERDYVTALKTIVSVSPHTVQQALSLITRARFPTTST